MSLADLPRDLFHLVAHHLDPKDLLPLALTSKRCHDCLCDESFGRGYCHRYLRELTLPRGMTWFRTAIGIERVSHLLNRKRRVLGLIPNRSQKSNERCGFISGNKRCGYSSWKCFCPTHGGKYLLPFGTPPIPDQVSVVVKMSPPVVIRTTSLDDPHLVVAVMQFRGREPYVEFFSYNGLLVDFLHRLIFDEGRCLLDRPVSIHDFL